MAIIRIFNQDGRPVGSATSTKDSFPGIIREWEIGKLRYTETNSPMAMRYHSRHTLHITINGNSRLCFGGLDPRVKQVAEVSRPTNEDHLAQLEAAEQAVIRHHNQQVQELLNMIAEPLELLTEIINDRRDQ